MTSFMQTMFVASSPSSPSRSAAQQHNYHPRPASPLKPIQCNILAASQSCVQLTFPDAPPTAYESPLHKHFRSVLGQGAAPFNAPFEGKDLFSNYGRPAAQPPKERPQPGNDNRQADVTTMNSNANARTRASFKPQRTQKGTNSWQLKQFAEATLGSGSLKKVVKLPEGEDKDEWLAVNVVDFYNQINLLYGAITEFCSPQSCPEMKATDEFEYLWHHPPDFPKPTRLPAPTYISHLLSWVSALLSDTTLFPTQPGVPFPSNFQSTIKQIFKRLYRIYAHIYCHHYSVIRGLGLEAHLNTGFKHYVLFVEEFGLADDGRDVKARQEWFGPLGDLVESMLRSD